MNSQLHIFLAYFIRQHINIKNGSLHNVRTQL